MLYMVYICSLKKQVQDLEFYSRRRNEIVTGLFTGSFPKHDKQAWMINLKKNL